MTSLDTLNAMLDELVDGVAYDLRDGENPENGVNMTVALYGRQPRRAAELLGVALLRLAEQHNAETRRPAPHYHGSLICLQDHCAGSQT